MVFHAAELSQVRDDVVDAALQCSVALPQRAFATNHSLVGGVSNDILPIYPQAMGIMYITYHLLGVMGRSVCQCVPTI
jgi:hypothetical protein